MLQQAAWAGRTCVGDTGRSSGPELAVRVMCVLERGDRVSACTYWIRRRTWRAERLWPRCLRVWRTRSTRPAGRPGGGTAGGGATAAAGGCRGDSTGRWGLLVVGGRRRPGSGVVYAEDLVLTAGHVLEREEDLSVETADGPAVGGRLAARGGARR